MTFIRALRRPYLEASFSPSPGLKTVVYERPGMWMSQERLDDVLGQLRRVAAATLGDGDLDYGVLGTDRSCLDRAVITIVFTESGEPVAFNALSLLPVELHGQTFEVIHLGLVMIDPGERSRGLSWVLYGLTCFLLFVRGGFRPIWISNVTQVPAVYGIVAESFAEAYPAGQDARPRYEHVALAHEIDRHHRRAFGVGQEAEFDVRRFVFKKAYTGGSEGLKKSFEECAQHRSSVYNEICRRELDYERGDDFLQLAQISMRAARRYAVKAVPKGALPRLIASLVFIFLQSIVLPMTHWFDSTRPYANLRPRKTDVR